MLETADCRTRRRLLAKIGTLDRASRFEPEPSSRACRLHCVSQTRLGLLGCGLWGRNILREAVSLGARVFVADPSAEARAEARAGGAEGVFERAEELPEVDGVLVATPASTHFAVISSLLDRGVPIFSEKPFTLDLGEAEELVSRAGSRIFVLHVWRYHPAVRKLRELVAGGELGRIRWLRTTRVNWTSPRTDCDPIWTLLPHDLSIVLEITGELPPLEFARAEHSSHGPCGLVGALGGTFPCVFEVSTRYGGKRREIRLHGDHGVAVFGGDESGLLVQRGDDRSPAPDSEVVPIGKETALRCEVSALIEFLRGGPPPVSSADDALLIARRMHEIRRMAGV